MANLKTYLQKLFKMSGSQAMPDFSRKTSLVSHSNCNNLNYTVTANGYVQARFSYDNPNANQWSCRLYVDNQAIVGSYVPGVNGTSFINFLFPVKKGSVLTSYSERSDVKLDLTFIQLVGN